jgi:hypothetical protein
MKSSYFLPRTDVNNHVVLELQSHRPQVERQRMALHAQGSIFVDDNRDRIPDLPSIMIGVIALRPRLDLARD